MKLMMPKAEAGSILCFLRELNELDWSGETELELDFSAVKVMTGFYMLAVGSTLRRKLAACPVPLRFGAFSRPEVEQYTAFMGFMHLVDAAQPQGGAARETAEGDTYLPITRLSMKALYAEAFARRWFAEAGDLVEEQAQKLSAVISASNPELKDVLAFLIREILRNTPEHGKADEMWICAQKWKKSYAEISIMDEGIGIFESLTSNPRHREYITDNALALQWAVKPGISQAFQPSYKPNKRSEWENSGYGLYMVSRLCKVLGGKFLLASYGHYISLGKDGSFTLGETDFRGTVLRVSLPTGREIDARALLMQLSAEGEKEASTIRHAFKQASKPSRGLMDALGITGGGEA